MILTVQADIKSVTRTLGRWQQPVINKAAARALNKTMTQVRTQAVRFIAKDIGIKQKSVRAAMRLHRAHSRFLQVSLIPSTRRFTLIEIDPRAKQVCAGVRLKQQGTRQIIPHAFIVTRRHSGKLAIVKRKTPKRYPLIELRGPSVASLFVKAATQQIMHLSATQAWAKHFNRELRYALSKV